MSEHSKELRLIFEDNFETAELDRNVWLPHYLPAWSSRAETAATYAIRDSCLRLTIPPSQGLWCAGDHGPPLRVPESRRARSGPVGSTIGQQPYRDGVTVREQQETFWGWTPEQGYIEIRARGVVSPWSMFGYLAGRVLRTNLNTQRRSVLPRSSAMEW